MTKRSTDDPLDIEVHGKLLREWDRTWKPVSGGFKPKRPELRSHVGLARAVLDGQTMYILRGTEWSKGGIEKGLQRIRGCEQTGNAAYGAQMLKKHMDELELEVLVVGSDKEAAEATKRLKVAMIKHHDPEWNKPHTRRLNEMRAGKGR